MDLQHYHIDPKIRKAKKQTAKRAWNQLRAYSPADLQALRERIDHHIDLLKKKLRHHAEKGHYTDDIEESLARFKVTRSSINGLLDFQVSLGHDEIPTYHNRYKVDKNALWDNTTVAEIEPLGDIEAAKRRYEIMLWLRDNNPGFPGEGIEREVKQQLEKRYGVSLGTIKNDLKVIRDHLRSS